MSDILFNLIKNNVYKEKEIKEISFNSCGKADNWVFDFKSQTLSASFLKEYAEFFWGFYKKELQGSVQIAGMETGAVSLIVGTTLCAPEAIIVKSFYIRKSRKKSDLANLIEGDVDKTIPVVLLDDILNSGATIRKQIQILKEKGCVVSAIFVCLRFRNLSHYQDLIDIGIKVCSIFELNDFSKVLPVGNLTEERPVRFFKKYDSEYKLSLTTKPNLYQVIPKSGPIKAGDHIYMGADDGTFFCLNTEDGSVTWVYKILFGDHGKYIYSTCVVYENFVMFGAYDGNFYCLNRFTGKREWVFTDADWIGSSPCLDLDKGVVFIGLEFGLIKKQGGLVAIDIKTGKVIWKYYNMTGLAHASPSYNSKYNIIVCGCNDNNVYALDAKTGELFWKFKTEGEIKYGAIFHEVKDLVVVASMDGGVYVLDTKNGALCYRFEAQSGFYSTAVISENSIIIGSLDKKVYCFDLDTKKSKWIFETGGRIFASPLLDKESIFIGSNDGRLYELEVHTGVLLSSMQFTERIVNRIQIDYTKEGKKILYVPTHTCELYKMVENFI